VKWNWEPRTWKTSTRILLGVITIWPIIYIGLFILVIFSGIFLAAVFSEREEAASTNLDLIQLERKIQNGEITELRICCREIRATDRNGRRFKADVTNESTREEIVRQARTIGPNNRPLVEKIEENSSAPAAPSERLLPFGFALFFCLHMLTILLTFALMPLYIVLAVKSAEHDQTTRIVWIVLMATMGMLVMPVYWYLYLWRKPRSPATATSA